mmetsp:Transcript_2002/g.5125  ORF Transcript_2002/g.5125 Transcript_2002/m.5125 type:complete len:202 (+) Transcript_2002:224-829(+)
MVGSALTTFLAPTTADAACRANAVCFSALTVAGYPAVICTTAVAPWASATLEAMFSSRVAMRSRSSSRKVRKVPLSVTVSGITLYALPPLICVTESTPDLIGSTPRETTLWSADTTWHATTTGSTARCGMAAWPPLPRILISNSSLLAMIGPSRTEIVPGGRYGQLWMPYTSSQINLEDKTPSLIIISAPPWFSSAGWNKK